MATKDKRFVIRKYITAPTAAAAIEKESSLPVDEIFIDNSAEPATARDLIGFRASTDKYWRKDEIR